MPANTTPTGRLSRWLFGAVHRQNLVHNQCWEDPAVDHEALRLRPEDRMLVITSAGCNALDYALSGAGVLAVDVNPRQNHLLELKRAGIRALDFESFFELFGAGGSERTREIYAALRHALPAASRQHWDREIRLFEPKRARGRSFYYRRTSGLVALAMKAWIRHGARLWAAVERLLTARSLEEQLGIYHREVRRRLLGEAFLRLVGSPAVMSLLGVPEPQRRMVLERPGGFPGFLRDCMDHVMSVALLRDNYFWSVYLNGCYSQESCPRYLQRESFARLKSGLRLAGPGARVIFRSGGKDERFLPIAILRRLHFERARAHALHRLDRVGTYGSFHIARFAPAV